MASSPASPSDPPPLPPELARPGRHLPPRAAASRATLTVYALASLAMSATAVLVATGRKPPVAAVPLVLAVMLAASALAGLRRRFLFRRGAAARGRVTQVWETAGWTAVAYAFEGERGPAEGRDAFRTSRLAWTLGSVPAPGDTAFLVYSASRPQRSALWSVAPPPGAPPRLPPPARPPPPGWLVRAAQGVGIAVSLAVLVQVLRKLLG